MRPLTCILVLACCAACDSGTSAPDAIPPLQPRVDAMLPELYTPCTDNAQCPGEQPMCVDGFCSWLCETTDEDPYGFAACGQPYSGPGQVACIPGTDRCVVVCGDQDPAWCPDGNCGDCPAGTVCTHEDYAPVDFCAARN